MWGIWQQLKGIVTGHVDVLLLVDGRVLTLDGLNIDPNILAVNIFLFFGAQLSDPERRLERFELLLEHCHGFDEVLLGHRTAHAVRVEMQALLQSCLYILCRIVNRRKYYFDIAEVESQIWPLRLKRAFQISVASLDFQDLIDRIPELLRVSLADQFHFLGVATFL